MYLRANVLVHFIHLSVYFDLTRASGMYCRHHPLYRRGFHGEIMRSWKYKATDTKAMQWAQSAYMPRYEHYHLEPISDPGSRKYMGLDYFATWPGKEPISDFLTIDYQRIAKTYLYVVSYEISPNMPKFPGWVSEGWVRRPRGIPGSRLEFGVGKRRNSFGMYGSGFIFSKIAANVKVPSGKFIKGNVRNLKTSGDFVILIGEKDGRPTRRPTRPAAMVIRPGKLCPVALHDKWKIRGFDIEDLQTRNRLFSTWHPLWDPCYFCSYGHEHGSNAAGIMGYHPRYEYVALKNRKQKESHNGFKDYVLELPTHWLYFGVHAHLTKGARFGARFHTLVIVAVNRYTRKKELHLSFKADYGALVVRRASGGLVGVTRKQEALRKKIAFPRRQRVVNVVNIEKLDRRFKYRPAPLQLVGGYETWSTQPICSTTKNAREPTFDVKDPASGMRFPRIVANNIVELGRKRGNVFYQALGRNREFRAQEFVLKEAACVFQINNIFGKKRRSGKFYTDQYGMKLYNGPGRTQVAQYVKPGFKLKISGNFQTIDPWQGLYQNGTKGMFRNIMYGILEGSN